VVIYPDHGSKNVVTVGHILDAIDAFYRREAVDDATSLEKAKLMLTAPSLWRFLLLEGL
jgi:hypothetical protein